MLGVQLHSPDDFGPIDESMVLQDPLARGRAVSPEPPMWGFGQAKAAVIDGVVFFACFGRFEVS